MKKLLIVSLISCIAASVFAQSDDKFYYPNKSLPQVEGLDYTETFFYQDGDTISSIFIEAADAKATVLFFHGNALNMWQAIYNIRPLVEAGYNVMMWDYRGFGKSTGTPTHINIAGDAQTVFDYLSAMEQNVGLPVILYGSSIGGHSATLTAKNNRGKVHGLVLDGSAKSFTELAIMSAPAEYSDVIRQYVPSPYSIESDLNDAGDIKVLFIHSQEDTIPYSGAMEMYEATRLPKKFWTFKGPHIRSAQLYPDELVKQVDWLLE